MTTLLDLDFEGTVSTGFDTLVGGGAASDATQYSSGTKSALLSTGTQAEYMQLSLSAGVRQIAGRLRLRWTSDTSGTASLVSCPSATGDMQLMARPGRKLRVQAGLTNGADSSSMALDTWYLVEFSFDTSTGTSAAALRIDTVAQPGASQTQTATDIASFRLGNTGTNTYVVNVDDLKVTNSVADHPLGGVVVSPVWTSPVNTVAMSTTPELKFTSPASTVAQHFQLQLDTANTFATGNLRTYDSSTDQANWAYWTGAAWSAIPAGGMASTYAGNEVRYTVTSTLASATWYRRVRAGTLA